MGGGIHKVVFVFASKDEVLVLVLEHRFLTITCAVQYGGARGLIVKRAKVVLAYLGVIVNCFCGDHKTFPFFF